MRPPWALRNTGASRRLPSGRWPRYARSAPAVSAHSGQTAFLASLPYDPHLCGRLEPEVHDVERDDLRGAGTRVVHEREQGAVARSETLRPGRGAKERGDLRLVEVGHGPRRGSLDGDVEDPTAQLGVSGVSVRDVGEEAVDRDQPAVPGGRAVLAFRLEVVQEGEHGRCAEIAELQPDYLAAAPLSREAQEELYRVSVGKDRVGTDVTLGGEVFLEEPA